jgi:hypothetical protein
MAHFAKLGVGNIIEQVTVVSNDIATTEQAGVDFLNNLYNTRDVWKQTSYNTIGGEHRLMEHLLEKTMVLLVINMMKIEMLLFHLKILIVGY